jgi:beta-aspartyl-peptidase (threonine type)
MRRPNLTPSLIAHGGAGARTAAADPAAVERGTEILRGGGSALDAVVAAVVTLEDDPLFNAGYGSVLNAEGKIEMDAALMVASPANPIDEQPVDSTRPGSRPPTGGRLRLQAGAVAAISRVRNPIMLARAVMERTPHVLMVGAGAERLARQAGLKRCRPEELVSQRARERWRALVESRAACGAAGTPAHGTVGAVAADVHGAVAAATSTGGMTGKLPGRVGDSAVIGAGTFACPRGAASATGAGEAIMKVSLCREAVRALGRLTSQRAAELAVAELEQTTAAQAGIIVVDRRGHIGYAHNSEVMEVAMFDPATGIRHLVVEPLVSSCKPSRTG